VVKSTPTGGSLRNYPAVEHFINKTLTPRFFAFALSLSQHLTSKISRNKISVSPVMVLAEPNNAFTAHGWRLAEPTTVGKTMVNK
jgi:hypothetical protein